MVVLWCSLASAAETWWVPDDATAAALSAATDVWPSVDHEVRVGEAPADADGWRWDGATLSVRAQGVERSAPASEASLAVLLGRTWALHAEAPAFESFVPEAPPVELDPYLRVGEPPPERLRSRWALGLKAGTRSDLAEPFPLQGLRGALTLEKGHVWTAIDLYGGLGIPVRGQYSLFGAGDGVRAVHYDLLTAGFDLGWKGIGARYGFGWVGPQARGVQHVLYDDRLPESEFFSGHAAVEAGVGMGLDARHLRADLAAWGRITPGLPLTVGVQLDTWLVLFNPRRRPSG